MSPSVLTGGVVICVCVHVHRLIDPQSGADTILHAHTQHLPLYHTSLIHQTLGGAAFIGCKPEVREEEEVEEKTAV